MILIITALGKKCITSRYYKSCVVSKDEYIINATNIWATKGIKRIKVAHTSTRDTCVFLTRDHCYLLPLFKWLLLLNKIIKPLSALFIFLISQPVTSPFLPHCRTHISSSYCNHFVWFKQYILTNHHLYLFILF